MANDLNSCIIEGRLTKDPEGNLTSKGNPFCLFPIATNRYFTVEGSDEVRDEVSYFDVEVWGNIAKACEERLEKGQKVRCVGRMKQDRWETAEGNKESRVKLVASHVEFGPKAKK